MLSANNVVLAISVLLSVRGAAGEVDESFYKCIPGLSDSNGVSFPRGQTSKRVGSDPFPLTCHLNPKKRFSIESLKFYIKLHTNYNIEERELESRILNETAIEASFDPKEVGSFMVDCRIVKENETVGVCTQTIFVGSEPLPPDNFNCISYNWQNLNCSWSEPANPVKSKYDLSFKDYGNFGRIACDMVHPENCIEEWCDFPNGPTGPSDFVDFGFTCTKKFSRFFKNISFTLERKNSYGSDIFRKDYENMVIISGKCPRNESGRCFWDSETDPRFRQFSWNLEMIFNVTNKLKPEGKIFSFPYKLREIVKPKPVNMTLHPLDPFTILVNYTIHSDLDFFPPGFRQQIKFQSEHQSSWTTVKSLLGLEIQFYEFNLTNLIPYSDYKVEVRILSKEANETDERLWSDPTSLSARTLSVAPFKSPETALGSFEFSEDKFLYVYWKPLGKREENGPDFSYSIKRIDEDGSLLEVDVIERAESYAKLGKIHDRSYTFHIRSQNKMGESLASSKLFVPSKSERNLLPSAVTKVVFNETLLEVSWQPPQDRHGFVKNYTIFWCKPKNRRDRPYQCDGEIDWIVVNKSDQSVNISLPSDNVYQVAVAANTDSFSSGMVWSTCTILHDKITNKVHKFRVDEVSHRSLRVSWRSDCSKRILGYKITYCVLSSLNSSNCSESEKVVNADPTSEQIEIRDLSPWTVYMVSIMATTPGGDGPRSELLKNRTQIDRPEILGVPDITEDEASRSLQISWLPPKRANGPIDFYEIEYSFPNILNKKEIEKRNSSELSLRISRVEVNTNYTFSVCACNMDKSHHRALCSRECPSQSFFTAIGSSSVMSAPQAIFINSSKVVVSWNDTNFHWGGPLVEYEVRIVYQHSGNQHIFRANPPNTSLEINLDQVSDKKDWSPNCQNTSAWSSFYNFSIRAVTIDRDNNHTFYPNWSEDEVVPAFCSNTDSTVMIIAVSVIISAIVFIILVVLFKYFYWRNRTFEIFKDVSKEVNHNIRSKGSSDTHNNFCEDEIELQNKGRSSIELAETKDCIKGLLEQQHRNVSGTSDTTSGCESGGPSCDESEEAEQPIMLMNQESLADFQNRTGRPLNVTSYTSTNCSNLLNQNSENTYIHPFQSNSLNPTQHNIPNGQPMILKFAGGCVTTIDSNQRLLQTQSRSEATNNGYVSLPNFCQLTKPNALILPMDTSSIDFDSIPPPKSIEEESKSVLDEMSRICQPQRLNWNEDNKIYSPSERTSELKNDLLLAQSAPKELQVTAVHSTQPKTVIVSSCDILLNERQSSMV